MPVVSHTLAYISLNDVASDKSWAFQSTSGDNLVNSTFTINADAALKSLVVDDDDGIFSDDDIASNSEEWGRDGVGQTIGAGSEIGMVGAEVEAEYQFTLSYMGENGPETFEMLAVKVGGQIVGFTFAGKIPPSGVQMTITAAHDSIYNPPNPYAPVGTPYVEIVTCFAGGTLIETVSGPRAIETLAAGDLVMTSDNGLQAIRWIGSSALSESDLIRNEKLRPIRISAGALGGNSPSSDLLVSPQHRILVRSAIAQRVFGTREVLIAAKQLLMLPGIDVATNVPAVDYFHMLFDRHEVVISNGAETESLYTGAQALKALSAEAVNEIFTIFPELRDENTTREGARLLSTGRQGRKLASRHLQNHKPLVC